MFDKLNICNCRVPATQANANKPQLIQIHHLLTVFINNLSLSLSTKDN